MCAVADFSMVNGLFKKKNISCLHSRWTLFYSVLK